MKHCCFDVVPSYIAFDIFVYKLLFALKNVVLDSLEKKLECRALCLMKKS